jgi:hypothetical protein
MEIRFRGSSARTLDFDIECRPLSYLGDFTTAEVTAIAARFVDEPIGSTHVWVLGTQCYHPTKGGDDECGQWHYGDAPHEMLEGFHALYDEADMVTGHFIRAFDLPVLNGAMLDFGLPPLADKLAHDTKLDLRKRKYMSASQENLAGTLGLAEPKVKMDTPKWRRANRLTPEGIELTRARVVGDVKQHVALRRELMARGWLDAPQVWKSSGSLDGAYTP